MLFRSFNWTNDGQADANATDPSIAVDNVTLRDSIPGGGGVDSVVKTFTLVSPGDPVLSGASLVVTNASCGHSNGSIDGLIITGGRAPYNVEWKDTTGADISAYYNLNGVGGGRFTFNVTDANGCTIDTTIIVNSTPAATTPVITSSSDTVCNNDTAVICSTPQNYTSYRWANSDTTGCIHGLAGTYNLTVTDASGCSAVANTYIVYGVSSGEPVVTVSGDTLTASGNGNSFQWYLNNVPISGATGSVYVSNVAGNYTVEEGFNNICNSTSAITHFRPLDIDVVDGSDWITIYPNPLASGNCEVVINEQLLGTTCSVFDANGRLVFRTLLSSLHSSIDMELARGIYILRVVSPQGRFNIKLVRL